MKTFQMVQWLYGHLEIITKKKECSYVNYTLFYVGINSNLILQKLSSLQNKI